MGVVIGKSYEILLIKGMKLFWFGGICLFWFYFTYLASLFIFLSRLLLGRSIILYLISFPSR